MQYKGKHIDPYESFYWNTTPEFFRGQLGGGISRTVKTDDSLAVMEEAKIAAMRGRNPDNPSERGKSNGNYQQRLEINDSGTSNTITSVQKDNLVVEPKVQQIGNIVDDSNIGFKNPQRGRVYSVSGLSPCLNCVGGGGLEPKIIITDNGNNETKGIYTESNETNTRKILQILREEVGEETYQWTIGRLVSIFKAEILQQGVYEEGICKDGETLSRIQPCTSHLAENSLFDTGEGNEVRDMRCDTEYRCASQGFQLSEQFAREFNDIMSQLPHKTASTEECMSYMWQTCKGTRFMQQTLHTLEEIWRPTTQTLEYIQSPKYRIRKLTCREVFRLMDVDDADIDKIQSVGISNSQQYKLAGNSIVVDVLYHIFRKAFVEKENEAQQLTLF